MARCKKMIHRYIPQVQVKHGSKTNKSKKGDKWAKLGIDSGSFITSAGIFGLFRSITVARKPLVLLQSIAPKGNKKEKKYCSIFWAALEF